MEKERSIRVFISSTFVDNQSERDTLVKKIFPQLRKICEQRNVSWSEVDLRWGISKDKIDEGKLIPIIIEEIKRCKPYFIGILGDRYGYVPSLSDFSPEILSMYPWLSEYTDRSITEMEIIYGAFENQEKEIPAFFYLRSSGQKKPAEVSEEIHFHKQLTLKEKIKNGPFKCNEYSDTSQMGKQVYDDFLEYINKVFPANELPDAFEMESRSQRSYAKSRGSIYIGGEKYFEQIDLFLKGKINLLIIEGASGLGKTAMLANWFLNSQIRSDKMIIFSHFIGATENSTGWKQMLTRFIFYLGQFLELRVTIPDDADGLRTEFKKMLANANSKTKGLKTVFLIDALNQLEDREGARELLWLPEMINENVYFILSSLPGKSLELLHTIKHKTLTIEPLSRLEQKDLIQRFLNQFSKTLDNKLIDTILKNDQTPIPLYLLTLLNELRIFGKYDELGNKLKHYLDANTPLELFMRVIDRLENDFESEIKFLVKRILIYIYVSRKGMEESELLELLSPIQGDKLPVFYWSPLYLSMENSLINHSGLINFSHDYLRTAVREKYIRDENSERKAHGDLASYYLKKIDSPNQRLADELPWHLIRSKQYKKLFEILSTPAFFNLLWKNNKYDLKTYFTFLENNSSYTIEKLADVKIGDFKSNSDYYFNLFSLLFEMGKWEQIREASMPLIEYLKIKKDWSSYGKLIISIGQMMLDGEPEELSQIMTWTNIVKAHSKEPENRLNLINSLLNLAYGNNILGKNAIAIRYNNEALRLAEEIKESEAIYTAYNNNAVIFSDMGKDTRAMELYGKVLQIGYDTGDQGAVQLAKGNMAWVHFAWGELEKALELFRENEKAYTEWGDSEGQAFAKICIAMICYETDKIDDAERLYLQALEIYREIKDATWIPIVTGWLGIIAYYKGGQSNYMPLLEEALKLYQKGTDFEYKPGFMAEYARILIETGNLPKANKLLKQAEKMAKSVDYKSSLLDVYMVKPYYYLKLKDYKNAASSKNQLKKLSKELKNIKGMIKFNIYESELYMAKSDFKNAAVSLASAEELSKSKGYLKIMNEIEEIKNDIPDR